MKAYEEKISKSVDNNIPEPKTEVFYQKNIITVPKTEMSKKIFNITEQNRIFGFGFVILVSVSVSVVPYTVL